ncbi:ERF family protein [Lactobacillus sp. ESL0679]|uniref:ERF family protein n=1 Tax=Lactobacillus sp. ESL0679 TaxID=2983209 RepID=UPI0023FA39D2|nr:ERF family protein [Lactobacillus sp. ESL0679]MDF7683380.1 ERF family protein [Lactobacillus sp. ESL0679]
MAEENKKQPKDYVPLAVKIAKANKDIGVIAKDGNNNFQRYSFQTEAAIKAAVQRVTSENGFSIIPKFEIVEREQQPTKNRGVNNFVYVLGTFTITDGVETLVGAMPGAGADTGEKAVQKACTSAQKYFYKQLFNITDRDEDPDGQDSNPGGGYQRRQPSRKKAAPKKQEAPAKQFTDDELMAYTITDKRGEVKLVQVLAEASLGKADSKATLHELGGESKLAYAQIYKRGLHKKWLNSKPDAQDEALSKAVGNIEQTPEAGA